MTDESEIDGTKATPNADELLIALNGEEVKTMVENIMTEVKELLKKIGLVLLALSIVTATAWAGTPTPAVQPQVDVPCVTCPAPAPQTIRKYEYRDETRVVQIPRTIETHIVPRITTQYEYIDTEVTISDAPIEVCPAPAATVQTTCVDCVPTIGRLAQLRIKILRNRAANIEKRRTKYKPAEVQILGIGE